MMNSDDAERMGVHTPNAGEGLTDDTANEPATDDIDLVGHATRPPELNADMLPASVAAFVMDVADRQGSPRAFVAVSLLSAFAGMIGNRVRLRPKSQDDWEIAVTLWAMLVGEPSLMKSPALAAGTAPLLQLEARHMALFDADRDTQVNQELERYKKREMLRRVEAAVRAGDDEAAFELLSAAAEPEQKHHRPRLVLHDVSPAKLVELLGRHPQGLFMIADELPRLLARLTAKGGAVERALFLQLFNGTTPFTYDRQGRPEIRIPAATLSLAGTIQPAKLAKLIHDSASDGDDGLLSRFQLAVWPDARALTIAADRSPDQAVMKEMEAIFERGYGYRLADVPKVFRFSPEAQSIYDGWAPGIRQRSNAHSGHMRSHLVKLERTICVLALIFELTDECGQTVGAPSLSRALLWADFLEGHAAKILRIGGSGSAAAAIWNKRALLGDRFTPRDVYRAQWAGLDKPSVVAGLARLERMGRVTRAVRQSGGRPSVEYRWTPR